MQMANSIFLFKCKYLFNSIKNKPPAAHAVAYSSPFLSSVGGYPQSISAIKPPKVAEITPIIKDYNGLVPLDMAASIPEAVNNPIPIASVKKMVRLKLFILSFTRKVIEVPVKTSKKSQVVIHPGKRSNAQ